MTSSHHQPTPSSHQTGLQILTRSQIYIFPWTQFLFAEGNSEKLHLAFSTHDVNVTGTGLGELLLKISSQQISGLRAQHRAESLGSDQGPQVTGITVEAVG